MADNTNNKRHIVICGKGGGISTVTWDDIQDKPEFATVATTGDYDDLTDKPNLATVATSGSYNDLTGKPTILTQWFGTQAEYDLIDPKDPNTIYNIEGSDNVQADWNQSDSSADDYIKNKPTIPAAQVNSDWNANSGVAQILNKPNLATVATTGNYSDLNGTPTIPAAPVQSNWNEADSTSLAYIANKPTIPAAQVNADWNSASGVSQILNKPTIPSETETLTFTLQGGTTVTLNVYVEPMPNYFYVEDISGSTNTLSISQPEPDAPDFDVFGSTDRVNWTNIGNTGVGITATIPANGKLYLKATTSGWSTSGVWTYNKITASGNHNIGGNIMSLLNGDNFEGTTLNSLVTNNLQYLFSDDTTLVSAEELILPTNVVDGCYNGMFMGCTSLTTAPALPATTLANNCYYYMFDGCTSLTTAPALPATTLATECYSNMFEGCTSLTAAPVLPATTLAENCYSSMFMGCTALTTSPVLPAATLAIGCYMSMFYDCSSLDTITTYAEGEAPDSLMSWVDGVAASGDFYNLGNYQYYDSGASGIPTGWTEHTSL